MRLAILERMNKECTNVKLKLPPSTLNTCIYLNMLLNANNLPWGEARALAVISIERKMHSQIKHCNRCLQTSMYQEERVKKSWNEEALRSG